MRWTWRARETNVADADGEVVWFWRSDAGAKFPERATRALGVTVATKHGHREEHEGNR
jgi:hypothetical protein